MKIILKIIVSSLAILFSAYLLPGVEVEDYFAAIIIAIVLVFLNSFVKPLLIIFTIPVTLVTFGLFLLVINALIILLADYIVDGFYVKGFWWAMLFSIILSLTTSVLEGLGAREQQETSSKYE